MYQKCNDVIIITIIVGVLIINYRASESIINQQAWLHLFITPSSYQLVDVKSISIAG